MSSNPSDVSFFDPPPPYEAVTSSTKSDNDPEDPNDKLYDWRYYKTCHPDGNFWTRSRKLNSITTEVHLGIG